MFHSRQKLIGNNSGKASKPNLAVVLLMFIILVQAFFLIRAYIPKDTSTSKPYAPNKITKPKKITSPTTIPPKVTPYPTIGKIAIIIDDSGYNRKDCDHLARIDVPVTISIMPQLAHSQEIAECANSQGKEVMLHMPLEPHVFHEKYPANYFIKTNMSSGQITKHITEALKSVPHVVGINNHEGSKATEDTRVMYVIFKELAKRNLFFVDSRVTNKSICKNLAEKLDLPFTGRDIFLDNVNERGAIEKQYTALAQKARMRGTAIAIGHARELSWNVMEDQIKKLKTQGYEFVTVQEIINSQGH